jgi:protein-tyrosine phosphatase
VIDLHSHLLPAVDDGSRSVSQSVKVLEQLAAQGITAVCLTPHLRAGDLASGPPPAHETAFAALRAAAPAVPRLLRGAEVMLDRPVPLDPGEVRRCTLGGTSYLLVEFHRMVAFETVCNALTRVVQAGLRPVLAHPERYRSCSPEAVAHWRELGAVMQVDATTLLSTHARGERARALAARGLADILAADNHGDDRSLAAGRQFLEAQDAGEQADLLTTRNPLAIISDEPVVPVPPFELRRTWVQRLRKMLDGGGE